MTRRRTPAKIVQLIGIADNNSHQKRHKARKALLREFRRQCQQFGSEKITTIDPLLVQAVKDWGFRIFTKPHPVQAVEDFLGLRPKPGKRAKPETADRDLQIAIDVVNAMREKLSATKWLKRMTLEKAAASVAPDYGFDADYIIEIYKRHHIAAKCVVAFEQE
jgi:hypothetical protein